MLLDQEQKIAFGSRAHDCFWVKSKSYLSINVLSTGRVALCTSPTNF